MPAMFWTLGMATGPSHQAESPDFRPGLLGNTPTPYAIIWRKRPNR